MMPGQRFARTPRLLRSLDQPGAAIAIGCGRRGALLRRPPRL